MSAIFRQFWAAFCSRSLRAKHHAQAVFLVRRSESEAPLPLFNAMSAYLYFEIFGKLTLMAATALPGRLDRFIIQVWAGSRFRTDDSVLCAAGLGVSLQTQFERKVLNRDGSDSDVYLINEEFIASLEYLVACCPWAGIPDCREQAIYFKQRVAYYKHFDGRCRLVLKVHPSPPLHPRRSTCLHALPALTPDADPAPPPSPPQPLARRCRHRPP